MTTYNVALKEGVDYDAFWHEIETNGSGSTYVPDRSVDIVDERPTSLRQCWYDLTAEEAANLKNDPRVYCVELPPEHRTDLKFGKCASQTGLYWRQTGVNPSNNQGINWGLFRINSPTNNTTSTSGTLTYDYPLDGTGVDFVIQDSGCQINHLEFQDVNGISRVQQIDWFTTSGVPGIMPPADTFYTDNDGHGTHCTGIAAGKTYGRAKNARIYVMAVSGLTRSPTTGISISKTFDCIKGWHNNKPIDPATGYKRPTVVNMSWGAFNDYSQIGPGSSVVYGGQAYPISSRSVTFGMTAFNYVCHVDSMDVDVAELIAAGVILVGAAGNYYGIIDQPGGEFYDNYWTFTDGSYTLPDNYYMRGGSPVSNPGVIVVGSVNCINTRYDTSLEEKNRIQR